MGLSARDIVASSVVAVLCGLLIYLYVQERGRMTIRSDQAPLGTIVFKKLSATRRIRGGLMWERMRNNGPVYQADTLRTGDASEASVCFDDGTSLDMLENSMLRLEFSGADKSLEFLGGDISISRAGGANADLTGLAQPKRTGEYTITAGGKKIALSKDSAASLSRTGDTLSVAVAAGEVGVTHADGTSQTLDTSKELQINLATGASTIVERSVLPLSPEQNARLLVEQTGAAEIAFSWEAKNTEAATLEVSETKDFAAPAISAPATGSSLSVKIDPGQWYWRVRTKDGTLSSIRRFTLFAELPPAPILPVSGADVFYRQILPDIRFSWSQMADATAYIFEIADNADFTKPVRRSRTDTEGITVNTLGEGTWYWRVTPVYAMSVLGKTVEPEVRTVVIHKRAEMAALTPTMPPADSLFLVQEVAGKGVAFSWTPDPEARAYELCIGTSKDMRNSVITRTSAQAWLTLSGAEAAAFQKPATWYWAVRWKDDEGNMSPYSQPRLLRGIDGALAVRLVFPPDGYTIADSLIGSQRFSWKCNVPAKAVFQLSDSPSFSTIAWESPADAETLIGGQWKTGQWYWRIRTLNVDGSVFHDTEARMFRVVDPLPQPALVTPEAGGGFHLRQEDPYTISWDKVDGADYYQFTLFYLPSAGQEVQRYSGMLQDTKLELPFGQYPQGAYKILLQAFGLDKPMSTRLIGYINQADFTFKLIARMSLSSPADRTQFEGLDARRHGINLTWAVPDKPDTSEVLVSSDPGFAAVVLRKPAASGSINAQRLPAGDYYWTVKGSLYGLDLSAQQTRRFTVRPIPLLPVPGRIVPARGFTFGPAELRDITALRFDWDAVPGATQYIFELYKGTDTEPMAYSTQAERTFAIDDLSVLENGDYRWTLKAQAYDANHELEQDGTTLESRFKIALPALVAPAPKDKETFYGR